MKLQLFLLGVVCLFTAKTIQAQIYDTNGDFVETFAGSAFTGYLDGQGQETMFANPSSIVADSIGNLFVWDGWPNMRIREIATNGTVITFAGGGNGSPDIGTNADFGNLLNGSVNMIVDKNNSIWIANGGELYLITSNADVSLTNLDFGSQGICIDSLGNFYLSGGNKIYRYSNGVSSVFAGSGNSGAIDGNGVFTSFFNPTYLACDTANNIYVCDSGNNLIRRIDQSQNVTTIAGNSDNSNVDGTGRNVSFDGNSISGMCSDNSGNIYFACGTCVRKMNAQTNVVTMAGSFIQAGYTNGIGNLARFYDASGICIVNDSVFVADTSNYRVREISFNPAPKIVSSSNLSIATFSGVTITGSIGNTYEIQSSPDMKNWTNEATFLLNSNPYLWIDQHPINGNKFYQAVQIP